MAQRPIEFPALAFGANAVLPPGAMGETPFEGALWRELRNLRPHDGALRPRERLTAWSIAPPAWLDDEDQTVSLLMEVFPGTTFDTRYLMVTTREIFLWDQVGGWFNLTPRYEVGTVSITSGTPNLAGVSTLWLSRFIRSNQQIELPRGSGDWYRISSVGGEGTITLSTDYTGATLAGANYSIRRVSSVAAVGKAFAVTLNGDLYVAAPFGVGTFGASKVVCGAVLRIEHGANPTTTSWTAASNVTYMTSGFEMVAGLDYHGYPFNIYGMVGLPDGRLVLGVQWFDSSTGESGQSRVLYSSHLNLAAWTTSPGGFTDIVGYDGVLTAVRRSARSVYVHFVDGIETGALTGDDDPPLAFTPSRASRGAISPMMIQRVDGGPRVASGDLFVGSDRRIYTFAGDVAVPYGSASRGLLRDAGLQSLEGGFSRFDSYREEVSFSWRESARTVELRVSLAGDATYEASYPALFYSATTIVRGVEDALGRDRNVALYGMSRKDDAAAATNLIYEAREDTTAETLPDNTGIGAPTTVAPQALSDFLIPPAMVVQAVVEIVLWVIDTAGGAKQLDVDLIRDGTTVALTSTPTLGANVLTPVRFRVEPPIRAAQQAVRITNTGRVERIVRMQLFVADAGSGRAA